MKLCLMNRTIGKLSLGIREFWSGLWYLSCDLRLSQHKFSDWAFIQVGPSIRLGLPASEDKRAVISALASTGQQGVDGVLLGGSSPLLDMCLKANRRRYQVAIRLLISKGLVAIIGVPNTAQNIFNAFSSLVSLKRTPNAVNLLCRSVQ